MNPGLGRCPGGGYGNPLQYSGLENPHGQRWLLGYSSWSHREPAATKRARTHTHTHTHRSKYTFHPLCKLEPCTKRRRRNFYIYLALREFVHIFDSNIFILQMRQLILKAVKSLAQEYMVNLSGEKKSWRSKFFPPQHGLGEKYYPIPSPFRPGPSASGFSLPPIYPK